MITVTDLFCGAGGSGLGASVVPGVELKMAANHWSRAIETHSANFPDVAHDCADISQVNPRRYGRTDILWASPECTNHSIAQGRRRDGQQPDLFGETLPDEAAERSRATMWDVPRFAEVHRYSAIVVENVVDVANWLLFEAWLVAMSALGYDHEIVYLNSMHAPAQEAPRAPQSRDRAYIVFWRRGNRRPNLDIRPDAWCGPCDIQVRAVQSWKSGRRWGRYRAQYVYRCPQAQCRNSIVEPFAAPASEAIDWSAPGQRIGDRDRPLRPATLARIRAGLDRYPTAPSVPTLRGGQTVTAIDRPVGTISAGGIHHGLLVPAGGTWNLSATPTTEPMRTRTTRETEGLLVPYYGSSESAAPTSRPVGTLTTRDRYALVDVIAPAVEDCSFRMLRASEVQAGMAFRPDYQVLGTRREVIRQLGNGVTPPAAEFLIRAVVESLGAGS